MKLLPLVQIGPDSNVVNIAEHANTIVSFHKLTSSSDTVQGSNKVGVIALVVRAHNLPDCLGGLSSIVERNSRHKVVKNVSLNNVVEDVTANESKVSVNGSTGTLGKGPFVGIVVRESGISVLKEGDVNQPVVNPQVRENVHEGHGGETPFLGSKVQTGQGSNDTNVRDDNVDKVLLVVQRRSRHKVIGHPFGSVRVLLSGNVGEQIHDPSKQLLEHNVVQGHNGSVLQVVGNLGARLDSSALKELISGLWYKHHVSGHVSSGLVVLGVTKTPRVIRDQQGGVKDPSYRVIDSIGFRKGTVSTLVGQDPASSSKQTLYESVQEPGNHSSGHPGNEVDVRSSKVSEQTNEEDIPSHVAQRSHRGSLVAVSGNGIQNVLDRVRRHNEFISKRVQGLLGLLLGSRHRRTTLSKGDRHSKEPVED